MNAKGDVTSVQAATKKFLFGMCDCTAESDVVKGDFSPELRILYVCAIARISRHGLKACWK